MHGEFMVVAIVLIIAVTRVMRSRYDSNRIDRAQVDAQAVRVRDDGEADRLRSEMRALKDRVQVLEAIVTDGDRNRSLALEREIEALRDGREGARP